MAYENIIFFLMGIVFSVVFYFVIKGIDKLRYRNKSDPKYFIKKFQRASYIEKFDLFFKRLNSVFITIIILLIGIMAIDYIMKNINMELNLIGYILILIILLSIMYLVYGMYKGMPKR